MVGRDSTSQLSSRPPSPGTHSQYKWKSEKMPLISCHNFELLYLAMPGIRHKCNTNGIWHCHKWAQKNKHKKSYQNIFINHFFLFQNLNLEEVFRETVDPDLLMLSWWPPTRPPSWVVDAHLAEEEEEGTLYLSNSNPPCPLSSPWWRNWDSKLLWYKLSTRAKSSGLWPLASLRAFNPCPKIHSV